jgi:hypothetical protein
MTSIASNSSGCLTVLTFHYFTQIEYVRFVNAIAYSRFVSVELH